jgi:hypothetical protein
MYGRNAFSFYMHGRSRWNCYIQLLSKSAQRLLIQKGLKSIILHLKGGTVRIKDS